MFGQKGRQWLADLSLDPVAGTLVYALDQLIDQASQEVQQGVGLPPLDSH
jgi:hypothetical protein